jgi:hypothetical protein
MSTTYQSPELAPKRPEIRGGAVRVAEQRVTTIYDAVRFVLDATEGVQLPKIEPAPVAIEAISPQKAYDDHTVDAALAAVAAAYNNPEETNTNFSLAA